ncbi:EF-hand domain-containing protein [Falsiroseomonas sp. E2-1-a4]|uniref:EF-hand domain-containing protein n=1 Tax=Falsiroseomonas sp. E2-1-a4 TaxID=3239299 RepID=UPI003F374F72
MSLAERFQRLDRDRSGFVTWDEARPQREAEHGRLDRNGDGVLTPDEFEDRALPFAAFDADRDGRVTSAEYLAKHQEMFAGSDTDGDGRISLEEFTRVQDAMRSAPR